MLSMLNGWQGAIEINGVLYDGVGQIPPHLPLEDGYSIKLYPSKKTSHTEPARGQESKVELHDNIEYRITVKQYMTRKASPDFDFMAKWNNDKPMPLRTMQGTIEKETRGMVYMHLHGVGLKEVHCMRCGRELTHPVSRHYGIGPECMQKIGIVADIDDVENIKEQLENLTWEGWVIKSAITEEEEV